MKTILAITAAVLAATPASAMNWADRTWGAKTCELLRSGYGRTEAIRVSADRVGNSVVLSSTASECARYVMNNCYEAYLSAPNY